MSTFDPNSYTGRWFEIARNTDFPFESGDCGTADYVIRSDGLVGVTNTQYLFDTAELDPIPAYAPINQWYNGYLHVYFYAEFPGEYQIIDTDYTSYAIVYSCQTTLANSIFVSEYVWLLSRTAHVEGTTDYDNYMAQMEAIMDAKIPYYDYNANLRIT